MDNTVETIIPVDKSSLSGTIQINSPYWTGLELSVLILDSDLKVFESLHPALLVRCTPIFKPTKVTKIMSMKTEINKDNKVLKRKPQFPHLRRVFSGKGPFRCEICNVRFILSKLRYIPVKLLKISSATP